MTASSVRGRKGGGKKREQKKEDMRAEAPTSTCHSHHQNHPSK